MKIAITFKDKRPSVWFVGVILLQWDQTSPSGCVEVEYVSFGVYKKAYYPTALVDGVFFSCSEGRGYVK
jgi:hypothetical protein